MAYNDACTIVLRMCAKEIIDKITFPLFVHVIRNCGSVLSTFFENWLPFFSQFLKKHLIMETVSLGQQKEAVQVNLS